MGANIEHRGRKSRGALAMLLQFRFKNFRSYAEEAVLDMTASSACRELPGFIISDEKGNKVLPVAAIYGANASGKSNVINAFHNMADLVMHPYAPIENMNIPVVPYIFNRIRVEEPTEYEVFLGIDEYEYQYGFSSNKERIQKEWLLYKKNNTKTRKANKIFERTDMKIEPGNRYENIKLYEQMITPKTLMLSILGAKNENHAKSVYNWFSRYYPLSYDIQNSEVSKQFTTRMVQLYKELYVKHIHEIDPCIVDFEIIKEKDKDQNDIFRLFTVHLDNQKKHIPLPIEAESEGTRKFLMLLFYIHLALTEGSTLFIDELDSRLHPLLLRKIVTMFHDFEINTGHGQLVLTAQNPILLVNDCLRRDEIWFTEKDNSGVSSLFSLLEFKDEDGKSPRSDLNYMKNYLSGRFGAIPFQNED